MPAPRGVILTGSELAQLRRSLLTVERQAAALREMPDPCDTPETSRVGGRLEEAVAGIRYLLDQAEARRGVH